MVNETDKKMWKKRGKLTFYAIIAAGVGLLVGLYIIAPMQAKSEGYVPQPVKNMPKSMVRFSNPDGGEVLLPLNIADEHEEREQGLNGVGKMALENTFLLYDQNDPTSWSEDYPVDKIKSSISFAILNGEGKVIKLKEASTGDDYLTVEKDHRWVLAMKKGLMDEFGVQEGTNLAKETLPQTD